MDKVEFSTRLGKKLITMSKEELMLMVGLIHINMFETLETDKKQRELLNNAIESANTTIKIHKIL